MTDLQVFSRFLVYGAGWLGTAFGISVLVWKQGDADAEACGAIGFLTSTVIWAFTIGVIYW